MGLEPTGVRRLCDRLSTGLGNMAMAKRVLTILLMEYYKRMANPEKEKR